jgi:hypothetical protein
MNLETFNRISPQAIGKFRMTTKGYYAKYKVQSVYKSELPTYNTRRFFLINNEVYELPPNIVGAIYDVFDKKANIGNLFYQTYKGVDFVNVPLQKFVLVNIPCINILPPLIPTSKSNDLPF